MLLHQTGSFTWKNVVRRHNSDIRQESRLILLYVLKMLLGGRMIRRKSLDFC